MEGRSRSLSWLRRGLLIIIGLLLLWVYTHRISVNPLTWEEPRRCLVASEMIHRGDYVVPRVLGEAYGSKPPLQSWLVVLASGNSVARVGTTSIRLISVLSILGVSLLLYALRRWRQNGLSAWLPSLIFLTMGITVQYGRSGEIDPLFTLWVTAAFACFEIGRRRGSPAVQWTLSQALLAGGILTKGLAPLFFYPPVLYSAWRHRDQVHFSPRAFALGLAAEFALVSAWIVPYALRAQSGFLGSAMAQQVLMRTAVVSGAGDFFTHLVTFPVEVLGDVLPWSILFSLFLVPTVRASLREALRRDPLMKLSALAVVWAFAVLWLMPGAKGRYLLPVYPLLALLLTDAYQAYAEHRLHALAGRWVSQVMVRLRSSFLGSWRGWCVVSILWSGAMFYAAVAAEGYSVWQPFLAGLLAVWTVACWVRRSPIGHHAFAGLLLVALLYAITYAGVSSTHLAEHDRRYVLEADLVAAWISSPMPVICSPDVPRRVCYRISQTLRIPLARKPEGNGPYYLVSGRGPDHWEEPAAGERSLCGETERYVLWEVRPSDAARQVRPNPE